MKTIRNPTHMKVYNNTKYNIIYFFICIILITTQVTGTLLINHSPTVNLTQKLKKNNILKMLP